MIDSILLRQNCQTAVSKCFLRKFDRQTTKNNLVRYFYRDPQMKYSPVAHYISAPDGKHYISVEASLPKLLFDHNVNIIDEKQVQQTVGILEKFAEKAFGKSFDAINAIVGRIDYCANFFVGENRIFTYLNSFAEAEPPYLKRKIFGRIETVEFYNKRRKKIFYDKKREVEQSLRGQLKPTAITDATGILRFEVRFSKSSAVKKMSLDLGLPDYKARTLLNFDVAKLIINDNLASVQATSPIPMLNTRFDRLLETYGFGNKLQVLLGHLKLCEIYGRGNILKNNIIKPSSYYKQRKELKTAGALMCSDCDVELPRLILL